ncbi:MAG: hypothetical protein ACTSVU_07240 [Promethearchaeota archaeon]
MGDKDLENIISSIGNEEMEFAQTQAQIDRLKQLVVKQKNEMAEQQKIINNLNGQISNMYDLPADVEELKRLIGEMRAQINEKDHQLEMAYGNIAQYEAQLKITQTQISPLNQQMETYITQVGELRTKLVEIQGLSKTKDQKIRELEVQLESKQSNFENMEEEFAKRVQNRLKDFMLTEDSYKERIAKMEAELQQKSELNRNSMEGTYKQISVLKSELAEKDAKITVIHQEIQDKDAQLQHEKALVTEMKKSLADLKSKNQEQAIILEDSQTKIEAKLREELFKEKTVLSKKIHELESQMLEKKLSAQEAINKVELAEKKALQLQELYDTINERYIQSQAKSKQLIEDLEKLKASSHDLLEFKEKNENLVKNLQGLLILFEEEPLFKSFLLVRDVGEIKFEMLKNALGVPSITAKKYVDKFVKADVFEILPDEKITLKYKFPK